jgi:dihydroorotase
MLHLRNIISVDGSTKDLTIESSIDWEMDGKGKILVLPALIDAHVHFRTPGAEYKENWYTGARAAIAGGVTTVCDMPNTHPACSTLERFLEKDALIRSQLQNASIPLRYSLYLGADKHHLKEVAKVGKKAVSLKIFMGSSTGDLLMDDPEAIEAAFAAAAAANLPVAVHAENEKRLQERAQLYQTANPASHSIIRDPQAAAEALAQALALAEKYDVLLQALHLSTKEEMDLIRKAKRKGTRVIAETTPHHLFLDNTAYTTLGTCAQMNPPLREAIHHEALWEAIHDGTIDTIGSDHAPHTLEDKNKPYPNSPSGVPGVETTLPLLLKSWKEGKLSLSQITALTRWNIEKALNLPTHNDVVLIDLDAQFVIDDTLIQSKCGWTPYRGIQIPAWPICTILRGVPYQTAPEAINKEIIQNIFSGN